MSRYGRPTRIFPFEVQIINFFVVFISFSPWATVVGGLWVLDLQ
jgi:hypothetical protein